MAKLRSVSLAGLAVLCAACAGLQPKPGRPAWAVARAHPDFPAAAWVLGAGEGMSAAEAADNAYADLLRALPAAARRELSEADLQALGRLSHLEVSWESRDGRRHAALAALSREDIQRYLDESDRARRLAITVADLEQAREFEKSRKAYPALHWALQASATGGTAEALSYLERLLGAIQVRLRDGDRRSLSTGTREVSLSGAVELVFPERFLPVAGAPVRISLAGVDSPSVEARTDAEGNVQAVLPLPPGFSGGEAVLSLDGARILSEADLQAPEAKKELLGRLESLRAVLRLEIASENGPRLRLAISETRSGRAVETPVAGARFAEGLRAAGLRVTPDDAALDPEMDAARAARLLAGSADLLLIGRVDAGVVQFVSDSFIFAEASGVLRLVQVRDGRLLGRFELTARAAGSDEWNASDRALVQFARKVLPQITEALHKADSAR